MKISYAWLQEYFEEKLPAPEKLADLLTMHAFEIDSIVQINADKITDQRRSKPISVDQSQDQGKSVSSIQLSDWVLDVKVMPDRAHDCMSYWGIAKEVGTLTGLEVKPMIFPVAGDEAVKTSGLVKLTIENENLCRRAMKRVAIGVEVGPTPAWLKNRLESVGQRSINNIVDIANFVMLETGQPVHTFDLDKLGSKRSDLQGEVRPLEISIRNAKAGEKVKTLDGKEFVLDESMLVIADEDKALDIAGVKGGANSSITNDTQNVLLSACNFDPINIRQTSKKLGLRTDASERFEKEISPALAEIAMDYLSFLVKEIAGGYLASDVLDFYPNKAKAPKIDISGDEINKLLGVKIKEKEVEEIFGKLRFSVERGPTSKTGPGGWTSGIAWWVTPPIERLDIKIKEDVVEEIGRIYGYEKIPAVLPSASKGSDPQNKTRGSDPFFIMIEQARRQLLSEGYSEVYTYTFQNKGKVELANPLAEDKKFLRANLSDGLKECINLNIKNLPLLDADEVKVFEIGSVFTKDKEEIHVAYGDKKEVKEMKLGDYIETISPEVAPLAQEVIRPLKITYKPISIYPFILRDIAVWVPSEVESDQVYKVIKDNTADLLAREPKLFDKFSKEGKISYAFKLVFQSNSKTLSDEEINGIMQIINKAVESNGWQVR